MSRSLSRKSPYAVILILLGLIALVETRHPFPFFRPATFILAFLALAGVAALLRGNLRDGLVVLASLAFGICAIEAVASILEPKVAITYSEGLYEPHPVVGWGPGHAGRFHAVRTNPATGATIYSVDYTIDADLLRQTISSEKGPAIVFFGDSFTFGVGVNDTDTLPQQFADLLDRKQRVLNLAYGGHGPPQFLRELQAGLFDSLIGSRPRLFIFLTAAWHAERTACKPYWARSAPRFALENSQLAFKGACDDGQNRILREWLENTASYHLLIEPFRLKVRHDDVELYIRIVLSAVNLAKEKYGVATLIPYLRASKDYLGGTGFSDESIIARLREGGAIVIDASLADEEAKGALTSIPGDGHPTPFANRARAVMLENYIGRQMPGLLRASLQ
ncbi:MAG: SGNH/GDSL hydrolase family protein [Methylocella sp.]